MAGILKNLFDANARDVKRMIPIVEQIGSYEADFHKLTDEQLAAKTPEFRQRLANGETLDDLLPEAFATVREAAVRSLGQRPFDTQMMGGIVLHQGRIAEMKTGEGKTLSATFGAYLNALPGKGVHVVTVNDYLARYHSEWMGRLYRFLGLSVGVILHDLDAASRKIAYASDITYGTNNEFGFDYLRDNMVMGADQMVQRPLNYAIVDEVDSILIDEARTPLIISGQAEESSDTYYRFADLVRGLKDEEDYTVDEKARTVAPTEQGVDKAERYLGIDNLYDTANVDLSNHLIQALRAKALMKRDRDYVVKDDEVIIVDEFTGRLMFGRRYSAGLHQAIEAKEGVKIQSEQQTLASVTFQNYFRMYKKLAGMTGTAQTEEPEFQQIYGIDVVVLPTNRPMIREDKPDIVYRTEPGKFNAVVDEIVERHKTGQPMLVGTISIEKSEHLSDMLKRRGVRHQVLNAKYHEKEADIIAQAGRLNAVTISTNMAGRGTDIMLGGNAEFLARDEFLRRHTPEELQTAQDRKAAGEEAEALKAEYRSLLDEMTKVTAAEHDQVVGLGGLHVLGTERHEARRIDNQLRGRSGRQGDPGSSQFFVSLEDDLMRLFGSDMVAGFMDRVGMDDTQPLESRVLSSAIERAQKRVEAEHFSVRKRLLDYDDVLNDQRELIYSERREVLESAEPSAVLRKMTASFAREAFETYVPAKAYSDQWDLSGLINHVNGFVPLPGLSTSAWDRMERSEIGSDLENRVLSAIESRVAELTPAVSEQLARIILLHSVDSKWIAHLDAMDDLREGIGLRAYGQRDPLVEYKFEAHDMFESLTRDVRDESVRLFFHVQVSTEPHARPAARPAARPEQRNVVAPAGQPGKTVKVGRNDPCPCGSGKKYKNCCGKRND